MSIATPSRSSSASTMRAWISESQPGTCAALVSRVIGRARRAPVSAATVSAMRPSSAASFMSRPHSYPRDARQNPRPVDRVAMALHEFDHRRESVVAEPARLEAELQQPVMGWAIVMLVALAARIADGADRHVETKLPPDLAHPFGQFEHRKYFGELVEDAQLAWRGRRGDDQRETLQRVAQIEIAAPLMPLAIDRQRHAARGLRGETVDHRTKQIVVMEMRE